MAYIALRTQRILHYKRHFHDLLDRKFMLKNVIAGIIIASIVRFFMQYFPLSNHRVWGAVGVTLAGSIVTLLIGLVNRSYVKVMR